MPLDAGAVTIDVRAVNAETEERLRARLLAEANHLLDDTCALGAEADRAAAVASFVDAAVKLRK